MASKNYVYMVQCSDGSYYTGWTTDPVRREQAHNSGRGAKYTRTHRPVQLVYLEELEEKGEALRREAAVKRLSHQQKQALCGQSSNCLFPFLDGKMRKNNKEQGGGNE